MSENQIKCPECGEEFPVEKGMQHQLDEIKKNVEKKEREKREKRLCIIVTGRRYLVTPV